MSSPPQGKNRMSSPDSTPNPVSQEPEYVETAAPSKFRALFVGPQGIRAGWRFVLYVLMVIAMGAGCIFLLQEWHPRGGAKVWSLLVYEGVSLMCAVVPAVVMARIEKRAFGDYGLPRTGAFGKLFWVGVAWGLVAITLLLSSIRLMHGFYFGTLALHSAGRIFKFAMFWAAFFLLVGFFEEFLLRGYSQFTLTDGVGFWPAAAFLSALFGAIHLSNAGEAWIGALAAGLIGFFFCLTLRRTGNLWFAVGFHFSFDWGETFLYSVPNSGTTSPGHLMNPTFRGPHWLTGGTVGPEGSVFVFVLVAVLWVAFDRLYPEVRYPQRGSTDRDGNQEPPLQISNSHIEAS
jgi:uncharacterized protein